MDEGSSRAEGREGGDPGNAIPEVQYYSAGRKPGHGGEADLHGTPAGSQKAAQTLAYHSAGSSHPRANAVGAGPRVSRWPAYLCGGCLSAGPGPGVVGAWPLSLTPAACSSRGAEWQLAPPHCPRPPSLYLLGGHRPPAFLDPPPSLPSALQRLTVMAESC